MDPRIINDDVRQQIWPLYRLVDGSLFENDAIATYYLDCMPSGFKLIYAAMSPIIDPISLSRVLPYLLLLLVAIGAVGAAYRAGGAAAGVVSAAFVLGSAVYLDRMTGGLPRSFGYPGIAMLMFFLARGRPLGFASVAVASVAVYPSVAVIGGLVFALWMLGPIRFLERPAWSLVRRIALVGSTALLMALIHAPTASSCSAHGPPLSASDVATFPELGPGGRYLEEDRPPFGSPAKWAAAGARASLQIDAEWVDPPDAFSGTLGALLLILVGAGLGGSLIAARSEGAVCRLWLLPVAAILAYIVSELMYPLLYIPTRYLLLVLPPFTPIAMFIGLDWILGRFERLRQNRDRTRLTLAALLIVAGLLSPAAPVSTAGWRVRIPDSDLALHAFIAGLPRQSVIAGWPGPAEPIESVPYLTLRPVLISWETHQVFHRAYALEMRRRMEALIDVFTEGDSASIGRLHEDFGVTHLVVRKNSGRPRRLTYFRPYDGMLGRVKAVSDSRLRGDLEQRPMVYEDSWWRIYDVTPRPSDAE
ncbi:MAG: hypothetical protein ABR524_12465 [Thermoanaerobaculia bacterium]